MKIGRYLILLLSFHFFVFYLLSCKKDSPTINKPSEKDNVENNLIQNEPIAVSDSITNNIEPLNKETSSKKEVNNSEVTFEENKKSVKKVKVSNEVIMDSPEFKTFMEAVFTLSNESTTEDLNYVNAFMDKNSLWREMGKDLCNLLKNEIIKSDQKVLSFWEKRCNFNKAQKKVVNKFNISYDALGKLMNSKRNKSQFNPDLAVPNN